MPWPAKPQWGREHKLESGLFQRNLHTGSSLMGSGSYLSSVGDGYRLLIPVLLWGQGPHQNESLWGAILVLSI